MFVNGYNYAELERWLNERGIKTSRKNKWHKNYFRDIFNNRRYLGIYIYQGRETQGGIPRIIDDTLFAEAQQILAKYRQAPSRGKAKVEYILSQTALCGDCGENMVGVSATSRNKTTHNYYQCITVNKKKGDCKKKLVRKQLAEDEVITAMVGDKSRNIEGILSDMNIDTIAAETYLMIQAEKNDSEIKRLEGIVSENQKAINNLMQALMSGKITDTIMAQIEKLENENKALNNLIASERALQVNYAYDDIRKWLLHFRDLDYSCC